jgi:hypothetical protein
MVTLSNGNSKYETGFRLLVSNVIRRELPITTVIRATALVIAMTDITSRAPCAADTVPP